MLEPGDRRDRLGEAPGRVPTQSGPGSCQHRATQEPWALVGCGDGDLPDLLREAVEAPDEVLPDGGRYRLDLVGPELDRLVGDRGAHDVAVEDQLEREGVAVRPTAQLPDGGVRRRRRDREDHLPEVVSRERLQVPALDVGPGRGCRREPAAEVQPLVGEPRLPTQFLRPGERDHQHGGATGSELLHQLHRRGIGPVSVVDHDDQRCLGERPP